MQCNAVGGVVVVKLLIDGLIMSKYIIKVNVFVYLVSF